MYARNVGASDASLRWLFGAVAIMMGLMAAASLLGHHTAGAVPLAIVMLALGADLVLTAVAHYSPLYRLLHVRTLETEK